LKKSWHKVEAKVEERGSTDGDDDAAAGLLAEGEAEWLVDLHLDVLRRAGGLGVHLHGCTSLRRAPLLRCHRLSTKATPWKAVFFCTIARDEIINNKGRKN
jgi:hypothetical protein